MNEINIKFMYSQKIEILYGYNTKIIICVIKTSETPQSFITIFKTFLLYTRLWLSNN